MAACYYKKCGQCLKRGGKTTRFKKTRASGNTYRREHTGENSTIDMV
jgi:hypothetical protein